MSFFTSTWSWVKIDGEGYVCAPKPWGIDAMCRVHDDSLSLSLSISLFLSLSPSLVTVDRFNTIERLTGPGCQRQSQLSLLPCLLSSSPLPLNRHIYLYLIPKCKQYVAHILTHKHIHQALYRSLILILFVCFFNPCSSIVCAIHPRWLCRGLMCVCSTGRFVLWYRLDHFVLFD